MAPKFQVFISSTYTDLIDERQAVIKKLLELDCIPVAMEFFQPVDRSLNIIHGFLDNCDYVVLIVAGRYGSVIDRKAKNISYTEEEFKYAIENEIPVMLFMLDDDILKKMRKSKKKDDRKKIEKTVNGQQQLNRFRKQLKKEQVKFYKTEKDLPELVATAFNQAKITWPRSGWIKADQASRGNILYSGLDKNHWSQIQHEDIKTLFQNGKGMSVKLKHAFPLTKLLIVKRKITSSSIRNKAISSKIYKGNSNKRIIGLNPKWISYELVYAMCYVSENRLHLRNGFGEQFYFSDMIWWESPWDNVLLYISQICSDEGFNYTVTLLLREANNKDEKARVKCLELIYRMTLCRPSVRIDLLQRLIEAIFVDFH